MNTHEITFNTNLSEPIRTRADFTYRITPEMISITDTGLGSRSVIEDTEAVLRKIEHWHQGSIAKFKITAATAKRCLYLLCSKPTLREALQEVVYQRELIGREVRPIQKRKLCSVHDGSIVDLAHSPGEYCDRCVGDRVHK